MISGTDYTKVLNTTIAASKVGLVIIPTGSLSTGTNNTFTLVRQPKRHPQETEDEQAEAVFVGDFDDITKFINGCSFIADSYNDLGIVDSEQIELAERDQILMNTIKQSDDRSESKADGILKSIRDKQQLRST